MKKVLLAVAFAMFSLSGVAKIDPESFRTQKYEAYAPVQDLAKEMGTSAYSQFENPTGIFFSPSDEVQLTVGKLFGETISLRVHNFGPGGEDKTYELKEGKNTIKIESQGLGYISFYTPNFKKAKPVKIDIQGGQVNGFYDSKTMNNDDWKYLLQNAVCEIIDIRGRNVQLAYAVASLKKHCPENGAELIATYETIIGQQHEIMGLVKYNRLPKNRMFGRVIWQGFMHADGMGAAFHDGTMSSVANPEQVAKNGWGIAHEFGHVNQVRPGMKWVSTTEVTNNIFSAWTQYNFTPRDLRLEHEKINGGQGNVEGGRFNAYLNNGVMRGEQWLCQKGPDKMKGYENGGDHFVKLAPLWQLQLYYAAAKMGNPDLYPDVFNMVHKQGNGNLSNGELQINFMRNACDAQKEDLTDFFIKAGMLKPIDKDMDDYSRAQLTITQKQCDDLVAYASRYPKPTSPVIYYINGNCVDAFKNRLAVQGEQGQGIVVNKENKTAVIDHSIWKNAVALETYQGDTLINIAMVGTGSKDNSSTLVQLSTSGESTVKAVAWDGTRTVVAASI